MSSWLSEYAAASQCAVAAVEHADLAWQEILSTLETQQHHTGICSLILHPTCFQDLNISVFTACAPLLSAGLQQQLPDRVLLLLVVPAS